jgi:cytochrome c biogenesis protein
MTTSTTGIQLNTGRRWIDDSVELISSMRFSISLLTLVAIASVIGTVVKQNEQPIGYVNKFGPFWAEVFQSLGIHSIYNAPWFIVIMAFLVISTSLCVTRNAPRMLSDMRDFKDKVAERGVINRFAAFAHKGDVQTALPATDAQAQFQRLLLANGYTAKVQSTPSGAVRFAAKKGTANRWGYILAHLSIVLVCVGGLLDSDVPLRVQGFFAGKEPIRSNMLLAEVPASGKMGTGNPSFRGNVLIPEGSSVQHALLNYKDGTLVQQLPFEIALKKFIIEYYSTGQPKLFASELIITDPDTGKSFEHTIKVNEPLIYKGVAVYQSSFEDGGSELKLAGIGLTGSRDQRFELSGTVGGTRELISDAGRKYTVEFTGFRPINVENIKTTLAASENNQKRFQEHVSSVAGSAAAKEAKNFRNVGPSVQYKLRDAAGQAFEYQIYMLPVQLDGASVYLVGMRETPGEQFKYVRVPADADSSMDDWLRLRAALNDPAMRMEAAGRFAQKSAPEDANQQLRAQLQESAQRALDLFVNDGSQAGYSAIAQFIEKTVAKEEQERAADVVVKVLAGSSYELLSIARERAGLKPPAGDGNTAQFLQDSLNAYSDMFFLNAPVLLTLKDFKHVQASGLQVARTPGKNLVYLGSLLLVLGVFAMFYVRERRLWAVLEPEGEGSRIRFAVQARKRSLDFEQEFAKLKAAVAGIGQTAKV